MSEGYRPTLPRPAQVYELNDQMNLRREIQHAFDHKLDRNAFDEYVNTSDAKYAKLYGGNTFNGLQVINGGEVIVSPHGGAPTRDLAALGLQSTTAPAVGIGPTLLFHGETGNVTPNYQFAAIKGYKEKAGVNDYSGALGFFTQNAAGASYLTEQMTISGNGNVGVGTNVPQAKFDILGPSEIRTFTGTTFMGCLIRGARVADGDYSGLDFSANFGVPGARIASLFNSAGSWLKFGTSNNYSLGITNTAMTIGPSGYVGVRTTAPAAPLHVSSGPADEAARLESDGSTYLSMFAGGARRAYFQAAPTYTTIWVEGTAPLLFGVGNTQRMKIDSNGRIGVGMDPDSTAAMNVSGNPYCFSGRVLGVGAVAFQGLYEAGSGQAFYGYWKYSGAVVGSITSTGSSTVYGTSSDYRLKEDERPVAEPISRLLALRPVNFAWKRTGERADGFMAHEVQAVVPDAVTGTKDAMRSTEVTDEVTGHKSVSLEPEYQNIDQAKLVPLLVAALQEAIKRIEILEARSGA